MSKHQRGNKELKKPKQDKAVREANAAAAALKAGTDSRSPTGQLIAADRAARKHA